jgi:HEAT repeat protein
MEVPIVIHVEVRDPGGATRTAPFRPDDLRVAFEITMAVLAPEAPAAVSGHRRLLRDPDVRIQAKAARDLGLLGAAARDAALDLTNAVPLEPLLAREAVTALGLIGVDDESVRQKLTQASNSKDEQTARRAVQALRQLDDARRARR